MSKSPTNLGAVQNLHDRKKQALDALIAREKSSNIIEIHPFDNQFSRILPEGDPLQ